MTKINWTDWNGGDCPVSETAYTIVKLRNGWIGLNIYDGLNRGAWEHKGLWNDIVKYSVLDVSDEPAPAVDVESIRYEIKRLRKIGTLTSMDIATYLAYAIGDEA